MSVDLWIKVSLHDNGLLIMQSTQLNEFMFTLLFHLDNFISQPPQLSLQFPPHLSPCCHIRSPIQTNSTKDSNSQLMVYWLNQFPASNILVTLLPITYLMMMTFGMRYVICLCVQIFCFGNFTIVPPVLRQYCLIHVVFACMMLLFGLSTFLNLLKNLGRVKVIFLVISTMTV